MRVPSRPPRGGSQFNITPLIDVVLLLIIFFLVSSHFVRSETLEEIDLPEATQAGESEERVPERIIITITADGALHVGGRVVELPEIETMLLAGRDGGSNDVEVHIRADRSVPYRTIRPIMLACVKAGVTRFQFPVLVQ